jgi:hypothetical protein
MLEIEVKSIRNQEDSDCVKIQLPASAGEFQKAFSEAGINNEMDCLIHSVSTILSPLDERLPAMTYGENALHELNFLAWQLNGMEHYEKEIFRGMLTVEQPNAMKALINLAANLDGIHFVPDARNTRELGEFLVENGFVEIDPEYWKYLDFEKIGEERLSDYPCCITSSGYIEDGRSPEQIVQIYDGVTLPDLFIPEKPRFERMENFIDESITAEEKTRLVSLFDAMPDPSFDKLLAVVDCWTLEDVDYPDRKPTMNAENIEKLATNLDAYTFLPRVKSYADYGTHCLQEQGISDPLISKNMNLYQYGAEKLYDNNAFLTMSGAVECTNDTHRLEMEETLSQQAEMDMKNDMQILLM